MSEPKDAKANAEANEPSQPRGRYRYQAGRPLDPDAGVHPEMVGDQAIASVGSGIPNSPQELMAMQENKSNRPEKPERQTPPKVKEVLDLLENSTPAPARINRSPWSWCGDSKASTTAWLMR